MNLESNPQESDTLHASEIEEFVHSGKQIERFPDVKHLPWLNRLVLSFNKLTALVDHGVTLHRLRNLDISHNNLTGSMPSIAMNVPYLEHLNVSFNKLQTLHLVTGCAMLTELRADNNDIQSLFKTSELLADIPLLQSLTLFDNPCISRLDRMDNHASATVAAVKTNVSVRVSATKARLPGGPAEPAAKKHVGGNLSAATNLLLHSCENLRKLVLTSPFAALAHADRSKQTGTLADGGLGACADAKPSMVAGCITSVTAALVEAAKEWYRTGDARAFENSLQLAEGLVSPPSKTSSSFVPRSSFRKNSSPTSAGSVSGVCPSETNSMPLAGLLPIPEESNRPLTGYSDVVDQEPARRSEDATKFTGQRPRVSSLLSVNPFPAEISPPRLRVLADDLPVDGEIDAATAAVSETGYRVTYSGRVLAGAAGTGIPSEADGSVALRVLADGTASCEWPSGGLALDVSVDIKAVSALHRYQALMSTSAASSGEAPSRAFRVVGMSAEVSGKAVWKSIDIDGFGVGQVTGNNGSTLLRWGGDGCGYHANEYGIIMRKWNSLGEITYVSPEFSVHCTVPPAAPEMAAPIHRPYSAPSKISTDHTGGCTAVTSGRILRKDGIFLAPLEIPATIDNAMPRQRRIQSFQLKAPGASKLSPRSCLHIASWLSPRGYADLTHRARQLLSPAGEDAQALRQAMLLDMLPTAAEDDKVANVVKSRSDVVYLATAHMCGYLLGRHLAVMYNLSTHELKLYLACKSFRYELVVASSTGTAASASEIDGTANDRNRSDMDAVFPEREDGRTGSPQADIPIRMEDFGSASGISEEISENAEDSDRRIQTPKLTARL